MTGKNTEIIDLTLDSSDDDMTVILDVEKESVNIKTNHSNKKIMESEICEHDVDKNKCVICSPDCRCQHDVDKNKCFVCKPELLSKINCNNKKRKRRYK